MLFEFLGETSPSQLQISTRLTTLVRQKMVAFLTALGACLAITALALPAHATTPKSLAEASTVNDNTVGIVFHHEDIYVRMIKDISEVVDQSDSIRMVPIIGGNHVQSIFDLLYMRGVDLALIHADTLEYFAREQNYERIYFRVRSLVKLFDEKVAVIANANVDSFEDLAGQAVNVGSLGSGSDVTSSIVLDTYGIEVEKQRLDKLEALEKVKSGELAAMFYLIEDPIDEFTTLTADDNVVLLDIPVNDELLKFYNVGALGNDDFPGLLDVKQSVSTISVDVIIASYNWPQTREFRYAKAKRFVEAFVDSMPDLQTATYQPEWQDISLLQEIPAVTRLELIDTIVNERGIAEQQAAAANQQPEAVELLTAQQLEDDQARAQLTKLISETQDPDSREKLENALQLLDQAE